MSDSSYSTVRRDGVPVTCHYCKKVLWEDSWRNAFTLVQNTDSQLDWKKAKRFCNEQCLLNYLSSQPTKMEKPE